MKKLFLFTFLLTGMLLYESCSEELLSPENNINPDDVVCFDESLTSEERAVNVLKDFIESVNQDEGVPTTYSDLGISIKKIRHTTTATYARGSDSPATYGDNDSGLPVFEFVLENTDGTTGFAVITAGEYSNDVIAYSEVGSIADTTFNEGLAIYFRELAHLTRNYEEEPIEDIIINGNDTPSTYLHIGNENEQIYADLPVQGYVFVGDPSVPSRFLRWLTPAELAERNNQHQSLVRYSSMWTKYVKLIVTPKWHQRNPYNARVPSMYYNPTTKRYEYCMVGCFNIAMGMVANHLQYPYDYNWSLIPKSSPIYSHNTAAAKEVSRMLYDFYMKSGTMPLGSAGNTPRGLHPAAMNKLGFSYIMTEIGSGPVPGSTLIKGDLEQNLLPLLLADTPLPGGGGTTGHIWVVGGYMEMARYQDVSSFHIGGEDNGKHSFTRYQQVAKLLHHNWGWGGDSDGWYYNLQISRQRDGSQYNFDYYRTIYTQIKPK